MRRELLFSFLGFLGGFVVAGVIFWQPAAQEAKASASSSNTGGTFIQAESVQFIQTQPAK